ncbi:hypothetical protein [Pseudescherichia sp.]|uniref:hypothetical protein n=1 Tax=Pseudescherichia sp. TaxID=2055881 RepID=UPI00289BE865|nr:hypothetical protein [Pseudescherichia sp.]
MNKNLAVAETADDEKLLDQLVQDLFLTHLRRELDVQKESLDDSNAKLFNLERKLTADFKKLNGPLETLSDKLDEQARELTDANDDTQTLCRTLLSSLGENRTHTAAQHEILQQQSSKHHHEQIQQLHRILEELPQLSAELQTQNVTLAQLTEQNTLLHQQLLALEDKQRAELQTNRRWEKLAAGFTIVNTLMLISMAALFILQHI